MILAKQSIWLSEVVPRITSAKTAQLAEYRTQAPNRLSKAVNKYRVIRIDIDWKAFEAECKKIVHDISDRFIDLGLEDRESDYAADQLQAK